MRPLIFNLLFLLIAIILPAAAQNWTAGGGRGMRTVQDEYLKWIRHMGSFKHSLFQNTKNKFKPCLTLKVSKNAKNGGFRSLQKAVNSLPIINRCRVRIHVAAGIYRSVSLTFLYENVHLKLYLFLTIVVYFL